MIREKNVIVRASATLGLCLWMLVLSLQCIHEWTHHHTHHSEGSFQCDHHHVHSSVPSSTDAGISMTDACLICDWDWLPFESIHPRDSHNSDLELASSTLDIRASTGIKQKVTGDHRNEVDLKSLFSFTPVFYERKFRCNCNCCVREWTVA